MRVSTAYGTKPGAILVVLAAATIAASCAQGPATPTAPSASTTTSAVAAHDVPGGQQSISSASNQQWLLLTKTCDAIRPLHGEDLVGGSHPTGQRHRLFRATARWTERPAGSS